MVRLLWFVGTLVTFAAFAKEPAAEAFVTVDTSKVLGKIKPMNSVNNGPVVAPVLGDQKIGNFAEYRAAAIPMARLHDSIGCVSGGAHAVDVNAVFPDFDANENDPKNYDFVFTDHYLDTIVRTGTRVFYRLGQTIEHGPKKYGCLPPPDFAKWARVCEHIVRHYNEGWGWAQDQAHTTKNIVFSNQFNIAYWEIWNEPDLDPSDNPLMLPDAPRCWGGTVTNFFRLYETTAKHLKEKFPHLKIGGPAIAGREDWSGRFLDYCRDTSTPLDFFSWHVYAREPRTITEKCMRIRAALDARGFQETESVLDEWNYVKGWCDDWVYSLEVESGKFNQKAAAFIAATMIDCQKAPVDHLMFYDARARCAMNSLFSVLSMRPMKGYYPYKAWKRISECGQEVSTVVEENRRELSAAQKAATGVQFADDDKDVSRQFRAVAAKDGRGKLAVFVARYSDDNNESDLASVTVRTIGCDLTKARCHMTDDIFVYTEIDLERLAFDMVKLHLMPNSFAVIEVE